LQDDLGWANVPWTRPPGDDADGEVRTPTMAGLLAQGVELQRAYAWGLCAPSRAAMQSGRHPLHVNAENVDVMNYNPDDRVSGYQGIPLGMVTLPQLLAPAGYRSYFYGKWDVGMATAAHTPLGRGYNKSLSYYHHHVDYWTGVYPQGDSGAIGYFPECLSAANGGLLSDFRPADLWEHGCGKRP
jgi:arylsulfatase B